MKRLTYATLSLVIIAAALSVILAISLINSRPQKSHTPPPYNIILIISDQQAFQLQTAEGYRLPAHAELQRRGTTFTNHYTAAAMCSPSRAALLTGTPPQINGVFDQMEYPYTPTLDPKRPNMGSVLKELGYRTAYFGKFEMDKTVLTTPQTLNTRSAIQSYGFDVFNTDGDTGGSPRQGYYDDPYFIGEAVRWLHQNVSNTNVNNKPFFMVVSLLNPHDIMYADVNLPGLPQAQQALLPTIFPPPADTLYDKHWRFALPKTLDESLTTNGMPSALREYQNGWATTFGFIPTERKDMWTYYYNYYLNAIRDDDQKLQTLINTLSAMNLWKNTIVIFTADHGEMGGAHGGLRGKGPMAYEENAHIPLIIAHPAAPHGATCHALTSHLDLLPTLIGFTGLDSPVTTQLTGHDFSALLKTPQQANVNAIRTGVLFNYVGLSTIDSSYLKKIMHANLGHQPPFPALSEINLNQRGFLSFVFDGRYKFARYYAPNAFNTPHTLAEIVQHNDVQLFDLQNDPNEANNLALDPEKNRAIILRMNELLNTLIEQEVGANNGQFLPTSTQ